MSLVTQAPESTPYAGGGTTDGELARAADQDSGDEFLSEMAKIRHNQVAENSTTTTVGKYKQRLEEARRADPSALDSSYKYPGYKARRKESLSDEQPPQQVPALSPSAPTGDVFLQVRTRRQEDLLKAARARKKSKEKKKAFGDQIKGVLAYLPFRTSHLSGFE